MAVNYTVVEKIAILGRRGKYTLELNIVKWGNNPEKYDLRLWDGGNPGRGVTFRAKELYELSKTIDKALNQSDNTLLPYSQIDSISEAKNRIDEASPKNENKTTNDRSTDVINKKNTVDDSDDRYDIDYRNFFVYGNGRCNIPGHVDQEKVIAVLQILKKNYQIEDVEVNAMYCPDCNAYYISRYNYDRLKEKGRILCQLVSQEDYLNNIRNRRYDDLRQESILHMMGYTVNAKDDLSDSYRQELLTFIIESGVITKKAAINHLDFLIRTNESRVQNKKAVEKWNRDRAFLLGYRPGPIPKFRPKILIIHGKS